MTKKSLIEALSSLSLIPDESVVVIKIDGEDREICGIGAKNKNGETVVTVSTMDPNVWPMRKDYEDKVHEYP